MWPQSMLEMTHTFGQSILKGCHDVGHTKSEEEWKLSTWEEILNPVVFFKSSYRIILLLELRCNETNVLQKLYMCSGEFLLCKQIRFMFTSSVTQQNPFVCTLQAKCVNYFLPDKIFAKHLFWESLCLEADLLSTKHTDWTPKTAKRNSLTFKKHPARHVANNPLWDAGHV